MNILELNKLLKALKAEEQPDKQLIDFYERKKVELLALIQERIKIELSKI